MGLNKHGVDWKAIDRDQKAIDKLPNKGRVGGSSHEKALNKKELPKERAIDKANRHAKKIEPIGYGTSKEHKTKWDKIYKAAGSKRH